MEAIARTDVDAHRRMKLYKQSAWYRSAVLLNVFGIGWIAAGMGFVFADLKTPWPLWHVGGFLVMSMAGLAVAVIGRSRYRAWSVPRS